MILTRVRIVGDSMEPAIRAGQWWIVHRTRRISPGDVVLAEHPHRLGQLIVKRAIRRTADGWWIEGDNEVASEDSRSFGPVPGTAIVGRVRWRYR